jgi:hypothetical protein
VFPKAEQDRYSRVDVTFLEQALNKRFANLLLRALAH